MSIIVILIIAILGLFGFSSAVVVESDASTPVMIEVEPQEWTTIAIGEVEGAIVPEVYGPDFGLPAPYWTPTLSDIVAAESAIAEDQGELDHLRQYVGFTEDGEVKIFINGFCTEDSDWTTEPVFVLDGGDCYFSAVYNVDAEELEYFIFNGDA